MPSSEQSIGSGSPGSPAEPTLTLQHLLTLMIERGASDLHLTTGLPPQLRIDGQLQPLEFRPLTPEGTRTLCCSILSPQQVERFEREKELDISYSAPSLARYRVNLYFQRGAVAAAIRLIPFTIPSLEELSLPPILRELIKRPRGLILVTGPTGSGKSTTLASMVDRINSERGEHILTIEDPIEYLHPHKRGMVNQRELELDTNSFSAALKHVLRQDPDVVMIGEIRDMETLEVALNISETGHLVLASLHTNGAIQTVHRVVDMFPSHQKEQARVQLSYVLEAVVAQQLVPRVGGGRVAAAEVLVANPAIRNLLREDRIHLIATQMQLGQARFGMQTMNQALASLYHRGLISLQDAIAHAPDMDEIRPLLSAKNTPS